MRIGLDGIPLAETKTGVGHYTFELAHALALLAPEDQFELVSPFPYLVAPGDESKQPLAPNVRITQAKVDRLRRRHWWSIGLPLYLTGASFALFHGTNYDVPLWNRCRTIVTIHDLSLFLHADTHPRSVVRRARFRLPLMARAASMIITATESVKREICKYLGVESNKVAVTPYAPRRHFRRIPLEQTVDVRRRLGIEDQFMLFVGTVEPRKNLMTVVRALEEIMTATTAIPQLVIVGREGWLTEELYNYIRRSGLNERLRFTGYVSEQDLCALYSSCLLFVYPSIYEGFGLPPLEAMACGAPVITSRIPSIRETVGSAATLIAPLDVRELARSMIELMNDENKRQHLSSAGLQRAAEFSWEKTASETLNVYDFVLKKEKRKVVIL